MKFNKDTTIVGIFLCYIVFIVGFSLLQWANTLKLQGRENPVLQSAGQTLSILSFILIFAMLFLEIVMIKFYELEKGQYNTILSKLPIDEKISVLSMFQIVPDSEMLIADSDITENSLAFEKILLSESDNKELTVTCVDIFRNVSESLTVLARENKVTPFTYYVPIVNTIELGLDESVEKTQIRNLVLVCPAEFKETFKFKPLKVWDREIQSDIKLRTCIVSLQILKMLTPHTALCYVCSDKEIALDSSELQNSMIVSLSLFNSMLQRSMESVGKDLVNNQKEIERLKNENDTLACSRLEDLLKSGLVNKMADETPVNPWLSLLIAVGFIAGVIVGVLI